MALSRLTASCCARRCSSSAGTCSCSSCSARLGDALAPRRQRRAARCSSARRCVVGRGQRPALGAQALAPRARAARACSSTLRDSAASTWICCCTCADRCRAARCCATCAARTASSSAGSVAGLLLGLRRQHLGLLVGRRRSARRCASSSASSARAALVPLRVLRLQLGEALLARAGGLRPRSGCALRAGSLRARPRPARPARRAACRWRRSAPGAPSRARPRRGAVRPGAPRARCAPRPPPCLTRSSSLGRVAMLEEPQLVQLERALVLQRAVLRRHLGLLLELLEVAVELAQDVVDARQVLARVLQPVLGLAAAFLVLARRRRPPRGTGAAPRACSR